MGRITIDKLNAHVDGDQFEDIVEALFNAMGYESRQTQKTRDGGKDVIIVTTEDETIYVEAKRHSSTVGEPIARDIMGAASGRDVDKVGLCTTAELTSPARERLDESKYDTFVINGEYLEYLLNHYDIKIEDTG